MRKGPAVALAVVAMAALIAAAVFATLYAREESSVEVAASDACGDRIFGHIASLSKKGGDYELRFELEDAPDFVEELLENVDGVRFQPIIVNAQAGLVFKF